MNAAALFPFGIRAGHDTVGADTMTVLTAGIHLDRRGARAVGWRGLRPSMSTGHAWTLRLAGRGGIYGLVFLGEERRKDALYARFGAFYFPDPEEKTLLAAYTAEARRAVEQADYFAAIRDFTRWEGNRSFFLGLLRLDVRMDVTGIACSMEAPARQRIVALDGLPEDGIRPGARACDVPAFRLATPLFRLLALSASTLLEETPEWLVSRTEYPAAAFTAGGDWGTLEGETHPGAILAAYFGTAVPPRAMEPARKTKTLSGRAFTCKKTEPEDFRPVLHTVSGFLGSGKTTFLAEWLSWLHNHDRHTAVLQNELGARSLDSSLLDHETVSETLDEGCVCCTLGDSLRPAIRRLMEALPTEQIILETTGVANPGAVADALDELGDMVRPGLRISLVDAVVLDAALAERPSGPSGLSGLMEEQIRRADVLVCNKTDMVAGERLDGVIRAVGRMNPDAAVFAASHGRVPFGELDRLHETLRGPGKKAGSALRSRPARYVTHRDEGYASIALAVTKPMDMETLAAVVRCARDRVPRIKGVIDGAEENRPLVVQYASGTLSLETPLSSPGPDRFLVFIGKDLDAAFLASLARFPGLKPLEDDDRIDHTHIGGAAL